MFFFSQYLRSALAPLFVSSVVVPASLPSGPGTITSVASLFSSSAIVGAAPLLTAWLDYGQPSAVLWKDQLFVAVNAHTAEGFLYRGGFSSGVRRVHSPTEYYNTPGWSYFGSQAKLDFRQDRVLLASGSDGYCILPVQELPLLENSAFGDKLTRLRLRSNPDAPPRLGSDPFFEKIDQSARYSWIIAPYVATYKPLLFPTHRDPDVLLDPGGEHWLTARYDVLIHGPKSVWLFYAYKEQFFVSVEPDYLYGWYLDEKGKVAKNQPKPPERQLRTGKLPADFTEAFAAYPAGDRHYLVTPNGKAYMVAPKGKSEVEVSAVWNDPKRKIVGVVQDQANDGVYGWGFATTRTAPERFYVKLGPKPVAVPYKLTVPLWDDRSDAYLESYECARAFRNAAEKK